MMNVAQQPPAPASPAEVLDALLDDTYDLLCLADVILEALADRQDDILAGFELTAEGTYRWVQYDEYDQLSVIEPAAYEETDADADFANGYGEWLIEQYVAYHEAKDVADMTDDEDPNRFA